MLDWLQTIGIQNIFIQAKDWRTQLRELAVAVKKKSVGERFIQTYEQKVLQARLEINQVAGNDTFAVLRLCGDQLFSMEREGSS